MDSPVLPEATPQHNWSGFLWGGEGYRPDRLYQGPFPLEIVPRWEVVMATTPSEEPVPNYGMGLMAYVIGDLLPQQKEGESVRETIEKIVKIPMASKLYIRPTWRQMQARPGHLDMFAHWELALELAEKHGKRLGFRVMLANPDIDEESLPDFVLAKVPMHIFGKDWSNGDGIWQRDVRPEKVQRVPHYHHPYFVEALTEFDALLAERYNGHSSIEFVDTYMYGFWGEGHTWPYDGSPFPDPVTAMETWNRIFEMQRLNWDKTPLVTNTQPDLQRVGNSEIVERTIRSGNWLRTDTIFIENQQVEAISNRPPWVAAVCEVPMSDGRPESLYLENGLPRTENIISHVRDVGANYWSLWNWHNIHADHVMDYYLQYPTGIDRLAREIGYRVRPSWVWRYDHAGHTGLILGLVNDGIAGVPGTLRLTLLTAEGAVVTGGVLDPGYPVPHHVRQARLVLPSGLDWLGLRLSAELEVKGVLHPVRWACREPLNPDGSLTLRRPEFPL